MAERVPVRVRDCTCPGSPHGDAPDDLTPDGDLVFLPATLDLDTGLAAEAMLLEVSDEVPLKAGVSDRADKGDPEALAQIERVAAQRLLKLRPRWFPLFVRQANGWNLVDEAGEPVPFDIDAVLGDYGIARIVADAASDLYQTAILAPFTTPPPRPSRNGRTDGGTHPPSEPIPLPSASSSRRTSDGRRSAVSR